MNRQTRSDTPRETLDEEAKPRTSAVTDAEIEETGEARESSAFPPEPPEKDTEVHQAVERKSWDTLKARPRRTN